MLPKLSLEQITQDLNLVNFGQDWGICNSDNMRLAEFTAYYCQVLEAYDLERVEQDLGDLLLESANEVVLQEGPTLAVWEALKLVAERGKTEAGKAVLDYWLGFDKGEWKDVDEEFQIVALLREVLGK